jgi:hypothetical protein
VRTSYSNRAERGDRGCRRRMPDYVRRKLTLYREARVTNLILCIPRE